MRNFNRNIIILSIAVCFTAIGFVCGTASAQTKISAKSAPTPKDKKASAKSTKPPAKSLTKLPAAMPKTAAKTSDKSKNTPKPKSLPEKNKSTSTTKTAASSKEKSANSKPAAKQKITTAKPISTVKSSAKMTSAVKPKAKTTSIAKPSAKAASIEKTTAKTAAKPASAIKSTPKPSEKKTAKFSEIIVSATSARARSEPNARANTVSTINIGKTLTVLEENPAWYKARLPNDKSGWISKTIAADFDDAKRGEIYQKIIGKYFKDNKMDFATASEIFDFLKTASPEVKKNDVQADLSFKRLLALSVALKAIPFGKSGENPYKDFLAANEKEVVYSEPSAEWYVRSDLIWELHAKYKDLPAGEEIAWQAAQTTLPGECEGYVNCYLYLLRVTDGEYLNYYPSGKYSKKALQNITSILDPIIADLKEKAIYTAATDISDRAEFNRLLTELRTIVSKVPYVEKAKTIKQINQIGEAFR